MTSDDAVRQQLLYVLRGGGAHTSFDEAVLDFPSELQGKKPKGAPYTAWQLLEHMRMAQWDILDFSRNPNYQSKKWPDEYWPSSDAPPDPSAWNSSVKAFTEDLIAVQRLIEDPSTDLYAKIPHGDGQTLLREAMLVADHNAYHLGQIVLIRRMLGAWKE